VKGLLSDLIAKLEREQVSDMREKEYCDREMKRTEEKQGELKDDVGKLKSDIDLAASASTKLKAEVKELQAELLTLAELTKDLSNARDVGHDAFKKDKTDLQEGLQSIRSSIHVLRDYYAADKDEEASFLQVESEDTDSDSFMEEDDQPTPPEKFEKSTSAGLGIIGLLEVVESDLAKNLAQLQTEEDDLQQAYESENQQFAVTRATKNQDITLKTKEYTSLDKRVSQLSSDHATSSEELSAINEYFAKVKDRCVAKPISYEDRKAKREAQIKGLEEALSILESQNGAFLQRVHK
jgi:chromosome segregation ATPase